MTISLCVLSTPTNDHAAKRKVEQCTCTLRCTPYCKYSTSTSYSRVMSMLLVVLIVRYLYSQPREQLVRYKYSTISTRYSTCSRWNVPCTVLYGVPVQVQYGVQVQVLRTHKAWSEKSYSIFIVYLGDQKRTPWREIGSLWYDGTRPAHGTYEPVLVGVVSCKSKLSGNVTEILEHHVFELTIKMDAQDKFLVFKNIRLDLMHASVLLPSKIASSFAMQSGIQKYFS